MGRPRGPSGANAVKRKATTVWLMRRIGEKGGRQRRGDIEEGLGLTPGGGVTFGKYLAEGKGRPQPALGEADLVRVVRAAYDKEWLDDWDVFELGLSLFVDLPLSPSKTADLFERRHRAYALFKAGIERMREGKLPTACGLGKVGRRRLWSKVSEAEASAAYQVWLDEIRALGARVMDGEEWLGWLEFADPRRSMEQTMWHWGSGLDEVPPPPWLSDRDYLETIYPLNHPLLLDRLMLITESDMPYTPQPERFELRRQDRCLVGVGPSWAAAGVDVVRTECGDEFEMEVVGDDIGPYFAQRKAALRCAEGVAKDLLDRLRGRKSGGADTRD